MNRLKLSGISQKNDQYGENEALKIRKSAISMAVEAIQVAAMAQKFIDSEEVRREEENAY